MKAKYHSAANINPKPSAPVEFDMPIPLNPNIGVAKKVWKAPNFNIKPISQNKWDKELKSIATMDLETAEFMGTQYPVAISMAYTRTDYKYKIKQPKILSELFLIELPPHIKSKEHITEAIMREAVKAMFINYLRFCEENKLRHFMVHNLGAFDGLFLFKSLFDYFKPNKIKPLLDSDHRFIDIQAEYTDGTKIQWKDSFRIFPVSLNDLCLNFGVEGKTGNYSLEFNDLDLFINGHNKGTSLMGRPTAKTKLLNMFKEYSLADSISLLKALLVAQNQYFEEFNVDILNIYSTASLAMKIFRQKFFPQNIEEIPILSSKQDAFIRQAYLGGATDIYKRHAENIYYYDVNSLYPYAQCKPMPYKCIGHISKLESLDNFFGFVEVEVEAPNIAKPMLPVRIKGKTLFPTGNWKGVYFSEELKAMLPLGYKFKLGKAYEFTKEILFKDYVDYFYNIKKTATGPKRFIAKMMLNNLYGIFGRALTGLKPMIVKQEDLMPFLTAFRSRAVASINEKYSMIITDESAHTENLLKTDAGVISTELKKRIPTKSNVAIAAAITSYARIHMIDLKLNNDVIYSDTDSIFTSHPIDPKFIGSDIGLLKDEMGGTIIDKAYFLGLKQYGYTYKDSNNIMIDKSVWAGVPKDGLSFDIIEKIASGLEHNLVINNRFYRDFTSLDISIRPTNFKIVESKDKKLVGNNYYPDYIS